MGESASAGSWEYRSADVGEEMRNHRPILIRSEQCIRFRTVFHVGQRQRPVEKPSSSMEGPGLSVTQHPDAWREIARLRGPTWELRRRRGRKLGFFFDMYSDKVELLKFAATLGLVHRGEVVVVSYDDDEVGDRRLLMFNSRAEAEVEYADLVESDVAAVIEKSEAWLPSIDLETTWQHYFSHPLDLILVEDFAIHQVIDMATDYDGLWWNDRLDPPTLSAPRGVIVPAQINEWGWRKVEDY